MTPCISASWQLVVTMVTQLAMVIMMISADYADEGEREKDGDGNDIEIMSPKC